MKKLAPVIFIIMLASACGKSRHIPDVSNIHVELTEERFDKDFFSMDTTHMEASLDALAQKYPVFISDYLYNLLAVPPNKDSAVTKVKLFIHDYASVYDSTQIKYPSLAAVTAQVARGLQFVKYYFPNYKAPKNLVTFIGPLEGYSNVLTTSGFAVGLQLYLGKNFPAYNTDYISDVYPQYQSRRFEPGYIPVDCIKNIIADIYPPKNNSGPLVYQMVEAGKRMYLLDQFLPETADSLKIGYTQEQLDGCNSHEALIWNYFVQGDLLYITDPGQTRDYMADGPKTEALGDKSPGFIGQFVGWQIVKKWMNKNDKTTLQQLLDTPAKQIYEEAKYKPR